MIIIATILRSGPSTLSIECTCISLHTALTHAVCAGTVSDVLHPSEAGWFTERFQIAAVKRYARLQAACTEQIYSGTKSSRPPTCDHPHVQKYNTVKHVLLTSTQAVFKLSQCT